MGSRCPEVVDKAIRDARQPLEERLAEYLVLPPEQLAGDRPGHLAERLVDRVQQPDVRGREAALERLTAAASAPELSRKALGAVLRYRDG